MFASRLTVLWAATVPSPRTSPENAPAMPVAPTVRVVPAPRRPLR